MLISFNKYRGITAETYANESSLIESMLEDFSSAALFASVQVLEGVSSLIDNLRAAQTEFNKANDKFTAANAQRGESATAIKKTLLSAINDRFVPYITAMSISHAAVYGDFAAKTDAEIEKINAAVAKRGKAASPEAAAE